MYVRARIAEMWAKSGLSCTPANRPQTEAWIRALYQLRGLQPPLRFAWAGSPHAAMRIVHGGIAAGRQRVERERILPDKLRCIARNERLLWPLRAFAGSVQTVREVGNHIMAAAVPSLSDQLSDVSWGEHTLTFTPPESPRVVLGQFDAPVLAAYEMQHYPRAYDLPYIGADEVTAVRLVSRIAQSAGPWWPFYDMVVISERPSTILLDDQQRLHNGNGPAVAYSDGWGVHAWHGVRVPADLIQGPPWTSRRILREPNSEIRRAAIERIGWDRFIDDADLAPVGPPVPDPGNKGQLLALYDAPEGLYRGKTRVLLCTNGSVERDGTRRRFGLTVPGSFIDPVGAAAWTFGWTRAEYAALEHRR
jgi:hypothetical protein